MEHALDLVTGLPHERSLSGDDDHSLRLRGCAGALALVVGLSVEPWRRADFDRDIAKACSAFGVEIPRIEGGEREVPSAPLVAFLSHCGNGGTLRCDGGSWRFFPTSEESEIIAALADAGIVALPLATVTRAAAREPRGVVSWRS
jgi:hypothetical protein